MFDTYDNAFYTVNLMLLNVYVIVKFAYELFVVYGFAGHWSFYFRDAYRLIEFVNLLCFFITVVLRLAIRRAELLGGSQPNLKILSLGHIKVDSSGFWMHRWLSSSSRSTAEALGSKRSHARALKSS